MCAVTKFSWDCTVLSGGQFLAPNYLQLLPIVIHRLIFQEKEEENNIQNYVGSQTYRVGFAHRSAMDETWMSGRENSSCQNIDVPKADINFTGFPFMRCSIASLINLHKTMKKITPYVWRCLCLIRRLTKSKDARSPMETDEKGSGGKSYIEADQHDVWASHAYFGFTCPLFLSYLFKIVPYSRCRFLSG